jgi:hypothetical protein
MKPLFAAVTLCALELFSGAGASAQQVKPQPSERDRARRVSLTCTPRRLRPGDTLTLDMSVPHGRDLAVLTPDDKFLWLRSWEPDDRAATSRWYAFEKVKKLRLATSGARGDGGRGSELIFARAGWYRIRISYNLETDDGTPFNECKVYYVHGSRRAQGRT